MSEIERSSLPYRQSTQVVIPDGLGNVLLVRKKVYKEGQFNFPGGGIDQGETAAEAAIRENKEELGITINIAKESSQKTKYEWPDETIIDRQNKNKEPFRGQEVTVFLAKSIDPNTVIVAPDDEISETKWVPISMLKKYLVFPNQFEESQEQLKILGLI